MEEYESILLVKPEVFVYKIPPRTTARGYRAADWNLGTPDWTGRLRLVSKKNNCVLKLEDKLSGELFAQCPIEKYPSLSIESVTDSSRYFVLRIQSEDERSASIGLGFGDRSDSFDLNVALQDHFKWINIEEEAKKDKGEEKPSLDLGFKDGQTIKINMKITKRDGQEGGSTSRPKVRGAATGLLPPPPGIIKPPTSGSKISPTDVDGISSNVDLLQNLTSTNTASSSDSWGDFTSATPTSNNASANIEPNPESTGSGGWVTF